MVIQYQLSPYPTLMEDLVVKVWEASNDAPGAEVYTLNIPQAVGGGHPNIETIVINGLDKVVHVVRLYTAVTVNKLHEYTIQAMADLMTFFTPIQFKIGDGGLLTPNAGDTAYFNPLLNYLGDADYTVFRNNYGFLIPLTHYTTFQFDPSGPSTPGGFALNAPDNFGPGEEFTIQIKPVLEVPIHDSVVGKWFGDFVDVIANRDYSFGDLRKLLRFNNGAEYTFKLGDNVAIGYGWIFQNFGSSQTTSKVNFLNAPLKWGNTTKNSIDIPAYCEAGFVFDGTFWNVIYLSKSDWVNAASPSTPGQNIGVGTFAIGNLAAGDVTFTVTHNLNITGDYLVFTSIIGTAATQINDNDVICIWYHHATDKANKFVINCQEKAAGVQNITIAWLIVKI
jgi:hypothetical protein